MCAVPEIWGRVQSVAGTEGRSGDAGYPGTDHDLQGSDAGGAWYTISQAAAVFSKEVLSQPDGGQRIRMAIDGPNLPVQRDNRGVEPR